MTERVRWLLGVVKEAFTIPIGLTGIIIEEGPQLVAGLAAVAVGQLRRIEHEFRHGDSAPGLMLEDLVERPGALPPVNAARQWGASVLGRFQDGFVRLEKRARQGRHRQPSSQR